MMNLRIALAVIVAIAGLSACVGPIAFANKRTVPLAYVGAIAFGPPVTTGRHLVVPLVVDYQTGEWAMNSGRVPYGTTSRISGGKIEFSVLTSLPAEGTKATLELHLPRLAAGDYAVNYRDPDGTAHALGSITIKE